MAYLPDEQDKLIQGSDPAAGGQGGTPQPQLGSGQSGIVSGGGGGSAPSSTPGTGGQGGWTNIQSYLDANKGNTQTGNYLNQKTSGTIDSETKNLNDTSSAAKSAAQGEVNKVNIGQDQASKLIQDASAAGQGSDAYKQNTSQLRGAVKGQYQGPTDYTYGLSNDYQNLKSGLNNNFQGYIDNLYNQASNNQITSGQLNLQHQLDLDPDSAAAIDAAKQSALQKIAGFDSNYQNTLTDTNKALTDASSQYGTSQKALQDYITGRESADTNSLQSLVDQWNSGQAKTANANPYGGNVNFEYTNDPSGGYAAERLASIDRGQFGTYKPGDVGTFANIGSPESTGATKNEYNTVSDILDHQNNMFTPGQQAKAGTWNFNNDAYSQALAALDSQMASQGYTDKDTKGMTDAELADWLKHQNTTASQAHRAPVMGTYTSKGMV